jgi:prepilin-type N-terminal cleavage/methylation domain-containing protein
MGAKVIMAVLSGATGILNSKYQEVKKKTKQEVKMKDRAAVISKIKKLLAMSYEPRAMSQRGFTLIELAIVLVIIGIILGAVLKGQDLVENARHKKLATEVKLWESLTWTYYDRKGRFPGDSNRDGTIGEDPKTDFTAANFINTPTSNVLTLGSSSYYLFLGNAGTKKNIIAVCTSIDCGTVFPTEDLAAGESIDTSIDGDPSGTAGKLRAVSAVTSASSATWLVVAPTSPTNEVDWTSATKAALYYFDRKP